MVEDVLIFLYYGELMFCSDACFKFYVEIDGDLTCKALLEILEVIDEAYFSRSVIID